MGNKANPIGLRLINTLAWEDNVFIRSKDYAHFVKLSVTIRLFLSQRYNESGLLSINILQKQTAWLIIMNVTNMELFLFHAGRSTDQIESDLRNNVWSDIDLVINQLRNAESHPSFIAAKLISDIALRASVKSSVRQSFKTAASAGALGLKASYSGRIYGVDIAQTTWHIEGRVPLSTLSANIKYASVHVKTNYGICNVKVWVYLANGAAKYII
ncbi:MAG: 30S ribosomal protein S3 [Candidatus Hodgkinia cicadicola]